MGIKVKKTKLVKVGQVEIGGGRPVVLIAGPCVIESQSHVLDTAEKIKRAANDANIPFIFKASYDKANRSSIDSFRGPGLIKGLKSLEKIKQELNVPVLALSQLSRQVEQRDNKKPQLSDLRESGSIEQDADVVMFVYREAYYLENKEPTLGSIEHAEWQQKMDEISRLADIMIGKQRHGPTGNIKVEFEAMYTKFKDLETK